MLLRSDLIRLTALPTLESVFAELVQQTNTEQVAREIWWM